MQTLHLQGAKNHYIIVSHTWRVSVLVYNMYSYECIIVYLDGKLHGGYLLFMHRRRILCTLTVSSVFLIGFVMGGSGPSRASKFLYSHERPEHGGPWKSRVFGPQMALAYWLDAISQGPKNSKFPGPAAPSHFPS